MTCDCPEGMCAAWIDRALCREERLDEDARKHLRSLAHPDPSMTPEEVADAENGFHVLGDWCWSCQKSEPIPDDGAFQVCPECFHVYATEAALLASHNRVLAEMGDPPRTELGDLRYFCGECIHDF